MTRATSKASLREEKENGHVMNQEDKILEIISIGGNWSLQEIMAAYRAKWGNIELSSVSARVNKLKDPENPLIVEMNPRKCAITDKTINPLAVNVCNHGRYKTKDYMMYSNAVKAHDRGEIKIVGTLVTKCEDCGKDISHAKRIKVKAVGNKVKYTAKKYIITIRGKEASMICLEGESIEEAEKTCKIKFGKHFEGIRE